MATKVIVMAAGEGTRMRSDVPKVLHEVAGRTLLDWVLASSARLGPEETVVVVGQHADAVRSILGESIRTVLQSERLGTGHAVQIALAEMGDVSADTIVVVPGDAPLLNGLLLDLLDRHRSTGAAVTFLTAELDVPYGYGRVVRTDQGEVVGVVEEADADPEQAEIREVNAGVYAFDGARLSGALAALDRDNAKQEYYLPDVVGLLSQEGHRLEALPAPADDIRGVNSHDQLAAADLIARRRINRSWMQAGVWMQDPDRVYLDADVVVGAGARFYPGVHLEGRTTVGERAEIGPDVFGVDSQIGVDARVWYSVLREVVVGDGAQVGPYASLRPGTVLEEGSKAGTFVEMKNTHLDRGAKVPHLSYMGDADIGPRANIGAGTITCNYDGVSKHKTVIGADAFIGSDTMLVAPVEIGEGAVTGAGSTITRDVAPGSLAVERSSQEEIPGYAARLEDRRRQKVEE
ncbi:MAG TPA: bifunctional UDP-N-acetylglucosamine diphosphorylase/glucosamine-1-phosphate N-acetyltransferase GlmU, partial [Acidimicrobiia bacterium]